MGPMDRRAFLFGALRPVLPTQELSAGPAGAIDPASTGNQSMLSTGAAGNGGCDRAEAFKIEAPAIRPDAVFRIGRWPDFPIGETRKAGPRAILIESLSEGLRARSGNPGGPCYAIASNAVGELSVDMSVTWKQDRVFSIMLGGPVRLETYPEENDERR